MTFITLTLFLVAIGLAFALGWALGQRRSLLSTHPELRFELRIPADTPPGDTLYLTGSFNDWAPADPAYRFARVADSISGAWVFTPGQVLEYKVTRGSWPTVEKGVGHAEIPNHVVTVTKSLTLRGQVHSWADQEYPADMVYDPRVERLDLPSAILGVTKTCYVFVPPEARNNRSLKVPCVYLLRGHEREWVNPNEDSTRTGRNVIDVYLDLREQDAIGPMVLVFPGMTSANGSVHSLGIDMRAPELANDASLGSGKFEAFFFEELIPELEQRLPILPGGAHRAIDGFSLGGFMSVMLALRHPGAFASVGSFDGLFFWDDPESGALDAKDALFTRPLFDANFGLPRDLDYASAYNPLTLLRRDPETVQSLQWLVEFGPQHAEPNVNYFRGVRLLELLHEHGALNDLAGALPNGAHTWHQADEHMRRALPLHWERIRAVATLAATA